MQSALLQKELPLVFRAFPRLLFALLLFLTGNHHVYAQFCPASIRISELVSTRSKTSEEKPSFTYPRKHFDLYEGGLADKIAKEMYALARPAGAN